MTTEQPPQGLQVTLGTRSNPVVVDTVVMANLVSVLNIELMLFILGGREVVLKFS